MPEPDDAPPAASIVPAISMLPALAVSATDAVRYDFCENIPASLRGRVYADPESDCVFIEDFPFLAPMRK